MMLFLLPAKNHGIYSVFWTAPSKNTGICAVFGMLQEVFSMKKVTKTMYINYSVWGLILGFVTGWRVLK